MNMKETIERRGNKYVVSTVSLPMSFDGRPYETMVFAADGDGKIGSYTELYVDRYKTSDEAAVGHKMAVEGFSP